MTKFADLIEHTLDHISDELQKSNNKKKINLYIVEPILKELSVKIQPFLYLMVILYLLLFVPLVLVLITSILRKSRRVIKYSHTS